MQCICTGDICELAMELFFSVQAIIFKMQGMFTTTTPIILLRSGRNSCIIWARLTCTNCIIGNMSPPQYRNGVDHPVEIICLCYGGHIIRFRYYVSQFRFIDTYSRTNWSDLANFACLRNTAAHSGLLYENSFNYNQMSII